MFKEIRGKSYPKEFVDWMIGLYGCEEMMPNDDIIWAWSVAYTAGYRQARKDCK